MVIAERAFSVTQVNEYVKSLLDSSAFLGRISVRGEISNFKNHYKTGHFYFTLKDEQSVLKAVMFQSYASKLKFVPEDSMQVVVTGRVSVFPRDGVYQLYAESMSVVGKGDLYAAFEQMTERLRAKGYFDEAHKKPIPRYPKGIGIITSPIGAAVADMKNIITRRYPVADIYIYPALVQGEGAAKDLISGIKFLDAMSECDVIIIGRGGGSIEDLWAFNDEYLAKAIFECKTPVISAVGHETDYTICDFVSDLRAPTPSAAAELAVPEKNELAASISKLEARLRTAVVSGIDARQKSLESFASKKCFTDQNYFTQRLEELLADLDRRISISVEHHIDKKEQGVSALAARLAALNPLNVLARGYAAVFDNNGAVVDSVKKVSKNDILTLVMSDGNVKAEVADIIEKKV